MVSVQIRLPWGESFLQSEIFAEIIFAIESRETVKFRGTQFRKYFAKSVKAFVRTIDLFAFAEPDFTFLLQNRENKFR